MKELLRQRARDLGFDDCRFTSADPPPSASIFEAWLARGLQGQMAWLARNASKRVDPRRVLEGVATIVTLAASHPADAPAPRPPETRSGHSHGVVARYARGLDYHEVLAPPLEALTHYLQELGGATVRSLWYVDTGPVLERDLAQRAGLGFVGKHTGLISRRLGNWFLLSEILTTLALEPDPPDTNHCGRCVRCLEACPTGALTRPFELDARLCISYLNIELRDSIPESLRPAVGARIFGCDDCLEVCPWNRFSGEGRLLQPNHLPELAQPDLLELLTLDEAGFRQRFKGTPLWRARRRGLLRNVCVALGNIGSPEAIPALETAANDTESLISEHARWAIRAIQARCQSGARRR